MRINWKLIGHILFNLGFATFFWGAFELAYQSPSDPIWSGTFGPPILHHYIIGAILTYLGYLIITLKGREIIVKVKRLIRNES